MRKLLLCLLLIGTITQAKDIPTLSYRDSIAVADTSGAGTVTFDTTLSDWVRVDGGRAIHVFVVLKPKPGVIDTNFTSDTFFVNVQFSMNQSVVTKTVRLDTLLDNASVWTGADMMVPDSIAGEYMRAMLIHNALKRPVASVTKVYGKLLDFYYSLAK